MGVIKRIISIIKANINELLNRAEDPEKILNQALIDMKEQLIEAKKQVAEAIADEKRLEKQLENEKNYIQDFEKKAMLAVTKGDDLLAKEALIRKSEHEKLMLQYKIQWEKQKENVEKLKTALRKLSIKIDEANRKKQLLITRKKTAEAQKHVHENLSALSDNSAFEQFERMEKKVEEIEAKAAAEIQLNEEMANLEINEKFISLQIEEKNADTALLELKKKMGLIPEKAGDENK